jgi:hypothetical protein
VNAYARSLPVLGFDPAPGDVGLTRNLARQHSLIAQEARQVLTLVERLNLSPLQGRAADALRTARGTFPPALRGTASTAESLQAAASSWANQLSGFQAEAAHSNARRPPRPRSSRRCRPGRRRCLGARSS